MMKYLNGITFWLAVGLTFAACFSSESALAQDDQDRIQPWEENPYS